MERVPNAVLTVMVFIFLGAVALGLFGAVREFRMSCEPGFVKVRGQSGIVCVKGYRP